MNVLLLHGQRAYDASRGRQREAPMTGGKSAPVGFGPKMERWQGMGGRFLKKAGRGVEEEGAMRGAVRNQRDQSV